MALASQGILAPKIRIQSFLNDAHIEFRTAVKNVRTQIETTHFLDKAIKAKKASMAVSSFSKGQIIELLEDVRSDYYRAAENIQDPMIVNHFLQKAVATQQIINQLRGRKNG